MFLAVGKRLTLRGFIISDHADRDGRLRPRGRRLAARRADRLPRDRRRGARARARGVHRPAARREHGQDGRAAAVGGRLPARLGRRGRRVRRRCSSSYGIVYSFGAFFDSMAEDFGTGKGATAADVLDHHGWLLRARGVPGTAADRYGPRPRAARRRRGVGARPAGDLAGGVDLGSATSRTALGVGVAVACAYVPMVATVGGWFVAPAHDALGVAVAGIGVGTLVLAPLSGRTDRRRRLARRLRRPRRRRRGRAAARQHSAARRPPVDLHPARVALRRGRARRAASSSSTCRASCCRSALFVPFVFIKTYATDEGIDASPAAALVGIIGASSVVGRLGLGGARQPPRRHPR